MDTYKLYGTSACHLCEIAEQMVTRVCAHTGPVQLLKIDISESDELFERYGLLIPVLASARGEELRWPFSDEALAQFFAS